MVSPQGADGARKKKKAVEDGKSSASSPEPFKEPYGMTTIDLNKSDDSETETDAARAKSKHKAQIRYVSKLLWVLCTILAIVLGFAIVTVLNKEFHLFPINKSSNPDSNFVNLTKGLNEALFRERLKSGNYLESAAMKVCKLEQTLDSCCEVFRRTELHILADYCTVNDMLNILMEFEDERRKKRQIDYYTDDHQQDHYTDYEDYNQENDYLRAAFRDPRMEVAMFRPHIGENQEEVRSPKEFQFDDSNQPAIQMFQNSHSRHSNLPIMANARNFIPEQPNLPDETIQHLNWNPQHHKMRDNIDLSSDENRQSPRLQSVFEIPLREEVIEQILEHVTVAPKQERTYLSNDFYTEAKAAPGNLLENQKAREAKMHQNHGRFGKENSKLHFQDQNELNNKQVQDTDSHQPVLLDLSTRMNPNDNKDTLGNVQKQPAVSKFGVQVLKNTNSSSENPINANPTENQFVATNVKVRKNKDILGLITTALPLAPESAKEAYSEFEINRKAQRNYSVASMESKEMLGLPQKQPLISKFGKNVKVLRNTTSGSENPIDLDSSEGQFVAPNVKVNKNTEDLELTTRVLPIEPERAREASSEFEINHKAPQNQYAPSMGTKDMLGLLQKQPVVAKFSDNIKILRNTTSNSQIPINLSSSENPFLASNVKVNKDDLELTTTKVWPLEPESDNEADSSQNRSTASMESKDMLGLPQKQSVVFKFGDNVSEPFRNSSVNLDSVKGESVALNDQVNKHKDNVELTTAVLPFVEQQTASLEFEIDNQPNIEDENFHFQATEIPSVVSSSTKDPNVESAPSGKFRDISERAKTIIANAERTEPSPVTGKVSQLEIVQSTTEKSRPSLGPLDEPQLGSARQQKKPGRPSNSRLDFSENMRANSDSENFRLKTKQVSAMEDMQAVQQAYTNPCFYPYMGMMPPPVKTGGSLESAYLKVIPGAQARTQPNPMYVLNPPMFYSVPPSQPTYLLPSSSYIPQGRVVMTPSPPVQVSSAGGQYYMCNPIPTPTNSIVGLSGTEVRREAASLQDWIAEVEDSLSKKSNSSRAAEQLFCPLGEHSCLDNSKCITNHYICDNEVQCGDSSDEIACTCKERVGRLRLCDGYCDCPRCEDEMGCFGCDQNEFSCDDWSKFRRSTCIPINQRCDGIKQCEITGKDELDCSILADRIGNFPLNKVSNAVGFLHRNFQGKWYPTCFGTELWAAEVCQVEAGPSAIIPKTHMTLTTQSYSGLFANILPNNEIHLVDTCVQDRAAFVECPPIYCGLRYQISNPYRDQEVDTSVEEMLNDLRKAYQMREDILGLDQVTQANEESMEETIADLERSLKRRHVDSRVVGGRPSQPSAWPWLVSIYRNGIFHCAGVIINEMWVVTAAHCVARYYQYYYEIQAGTLRRFSYAPMDQRRWAKAIIPHANYDKEFLRNDIALMHLSAPIRYNRHVRPICLPSESTAGSQHLKAPIFGTVCTTVGWGATIEHGADPDHMRETDIPILSHCKHKDDSDVDEICAGLAEGGKDACQGDSGGPLMCRNPKNANQWYLGGIVSHGQGCARPHEPGVYTRVSKYLDWIAENTNEARRTMTLPLQKCPGYVCKTIRRCIAKKRRCDGIVDCLLGDDELNCPGHFNDIFQHSKNDASMVQQDVAEDPLEELEAAEVLGNPPDLNESFTSITNETELKVQSLMQGFDGWNFRCQVLLQVVPMEKRCNRLTDCQDGSDEANCTCAHFVQAVDPTAICDGIADCADLSDESNCVKCKETEFTCKMSKTCISLSRRCDGQLDCPLKEDEMDCAALTSGLIIDLDKDDRPTLQTKGFLTLYHKGRWKPICFGDDRNKAAMATSQCNLLGFHDYISYSQHSVQTDMLMVLNSTMKKPTKSETCEGLYVNCGNVSSSSSLYYSGLEQARELYLSPWMAVIYSDGHYRCMGTLLDKSWIVTSRKCFSGIDRLQQSYVVAVLGKGKLHLDVPGPHEQILRIHNSSIISSTDIVLLRLADKVQFTRYVQAADLNARWDGEKREKCYAVGRYNDNKVHFLPLFPRENCTNGYRCFEKKLEDNCKDTSAWMGTIICDSRLGWYPAAVFSEPQGHCGFSVKKKYTSIRFYKPQIQELMARRLAPGTPPVCDGFRCPMGACLAPTQTCNGVQDCHDGSDESTTLCYENENKCYLNNQCECPATQMKCPSGKCVPKSAFCNLKDDCGDKADEPPTCNCKNYLELANPEKICDGTINCADRTDEDPQLCPCQPGHFQCGQSGKCVPQEMICDGKTDCPGGEDEASCFAFRSNKNAKANAGEVWTRMAGIWTPGCFKTNYTQSDLDELCTKLGFYGTTAFELTPTNNSTAVPAKRPVLDQFDVVWLERTPGHQLRMLIRTGNNPYVRLVPDNKCHVLNIACV